ncbi:ligase-associated DNA damage response DEXH box helicase [Acidovorax sp. sic0104]|uniref:ligase-associated DNA damage response DEXH box helicase n=1 Tax=Acidovorax sp. sic0104 TaxID=2854784 RepID=UPI001C48D175|nr:ligase-associated DNA damage response DEXH box helicase [Acidovorax sp. sic0104]MBV7542521.1 ligase-associated DNA damage response DEXH box helicase [Acidovorax sp. sic0104]
MNTARRPRKQVSTQAAGAAAAWMAARGWQAFAFQHEVWKALGEGRSGLLHATTGAGKTYAVWLGALQHLALPPTVRAEPVEAGTRTDANPSMHSASAASGTSPVLPSNEAAGTRARRASAPPLAVLWITPMRALAADTLRALQAPLPDLAPDWTSGLRTGDTASSERAAQDRRLPTLLVTTPESVSLLLARADARERLERVRLVVVDEWHELVGNKRGVQAQLALARLSGWNPALQVWGMSATLGNLQEALHTLLPSPVPDAPAAPPAALVQGRIDKALRVDVMLPPKVDRFAWAGHMGLALLPQVVNSIEACASTLVFTNTRSQAERWYQALLEARPDWAGTIALHHGSLSQEVRAWVEAGLKAGQLKAVVCTSSLDLGVDFLPVEQVLQIGSAKGVGRLVQRAGRSGHAPGRTSSITLVPTHSLELVEAAAARHALAQGRIEDRHTPRAPLDVLVQHLVTIALGGGFVPDALLAEVRRAPAYATLADNDWQWALQFVRQGGASLATYPDFQRAVPDEDGTWRVPDARLARRHRSNIGTIVSDASMQVQFVSGGRLGSVEESFIARLRKGDVFMFAGRLLELVRTQQMTAYVRIAPKGSASLPRWNGGRMPLSNTLADAMLEMLEQAERGIYASPEMQCARPLLAVQHAWSALPTPGRLVAETLHTREGWHLYLYPLAGRLVHLGLAGLLAWRASREVANTFSIAVNDYGLELLSAKPIDWSALLPRILGEGTPTTLGSGLEDEVLASLNATEMARRRFREIARIAGLIFQSHPGEQRSSRQLQASSSLYYDVFAQYDPGNLLLAQARAELLANELDMDRLARTLRGMQAQTLSIHAIERPTPFALPLMVERFRERLSTETLADRLARMVQALEKAADDTTGTHEADNPVQPADMAWDVPDGATAAARRPRRSNGEGAARRPRRRHGF